MPCKLIHSTIYPAYQRTRKHLTAVQNGRTFCYQFHHAGIFENVYGVRGESINFAMMDNFGCPLRSDCSSLALEAFEGFMVQADEELTDQRDVDIDEIGAHERIDYYEQEKRFIICDWLYGWGRELVDLETDEIID